MTTTPSASPAVARKLLLARIADTQKRADLARKKAKEAKVDFQHAKVKFKEAKRAAKKLRKAVKSLKADLAALGAIRVRRKPAAKKPAARRPRPVVIPSFELASPTAPAPVESPAPAADNPPVAPVAQ